HRRVELREVADAERALRRQARKLQVQTLRPGERAFGTHEQVRRVGVRRAEMVEVVARDLAQHFPKAGLDLGALSPVQRFQFGDESAIRRWTAGVIERTEAPALAFDR